MDRHDCYELYGVTQSYNGRTVVQIEELAVREGEILAVVGPSGAGKSTLLRLLNFLETPCAGRIRFRGADFGPGQPAPLAVRRQVTTVFQRPALLDRSVWDNVIYGLRLRGQRNGHAQAGKVLDIVGLKSLARQRARLLSGGEAQRVALARALVLKPAVLLLDEPTANLDPYNVGLIEAIVRQFNEEEAGTVVLVTHNIFQARRLAHRAAFMLDGRIVEVANVEAFFERPQDPRTKAFVRGEMVY